MEPLNFATTISVLKPLIVFVIAMSIYSVFIFKFYKFLAKRNVIELGLGNYNRTNHWALKTVFGMIFYFVEYIFIMPLFIIFWFGVLSILLMFMSKNPVDTILLVSIAVVGAIRVCAYYSRDLAEDLSKMLPFALLGVFLVDISFFQLDTALNLIKDIPNHLSLIVYYCTFIVILEIFLRVVYMISFPFIQAKKEEVKNDKLKDIDL